MFRCFRNTNKHVLSPEPEYNAMKSVTEIPDTLLYVMLTTYISLTISIQQPP